jgi:5-(carboxyamino)imidazole ribonucleotide mutase
MPDPLPSSPTFPEIAIVMGSQSDWPTLEHASTLLDRFKIPHECLVVSAHRTPAWLTEFATQAHTKGLKLIIAGAGGAAHLPGMIAAQTHLPVLGVPIESKALHGIDSLLSIVQMPAGIPVGTLAIGKPGAINAALMGVSILALSNPTLQKDLEDYRAQQTHEVLKTKLLKQSFCGNGSNTLDASSP